MISLEESKKVIKVRMGSWLLKLLSRGMKTKINKQAIRKATTKIKRLENTTPIMGYYPRNGQMGDTNRYFPSIHFWDSSP